MQDASPISAKITEKMIAQKEGAIGWMTFNNPARRNAISVAMWEAVPVILDDFEQDDAIKVIVLKGAGDQAFISGADISEFEQQRASTEAVGRYEELAESAGKRLKECPKPVVAMIRGYCVGGGVGVALGCDIRIAGEGAKFAIPAARLGLGYRFSGIQTLVNVVGPSYAKEIFFTAKRYGSEEALRMGLVNKVVPDDQLEAAVRDYCDTIAENAPLTIRSVKEIVGELTKTSKDVDREFCERSMRRCFESEDYIEGRRAFMEKRKPVFRGR